MIPFNRLDSALFSRLLGLDHVQLATQLEHRDQDLNEQQREVAKGQAEDKRPRRRVNGEI